jgi:hypothetical protein
MTSTETRARQRFLDTMRLFFPTTDINTLESAPISTFQFENQDPFTLVPCEKFYLQSAFFGIS